MKNRIERTRLTRGGRLAALAAAVSLSAAASVAVASPSGTTTVATNLGKLGQMLAASNGRTLYLFTHDSGTKSSCYGSCAQVWTPLQTQGRPAAAQGSGVNPKLLGTTRRRNRALQATYNGHPLYLFAGDKKPGDTHGENINHFGGRWYAVSTKGSALKPKKHGGPVCNPLCQGY